MLTVLLIILPFLAGIFLIFGGKNKNSYWACSTALAASLLEMAVSLYMFGTFDTQHSAQYQFLTNVPWVQELGINFKVGIDGISLWLVLLSTCLTPLIIATGIKKEYANANTFYGLILLMQAALIGVFTALDGFLFYVFWELALLPICLICWWWGGENRTNITFKFFMYTLAGSLLMLVGLIYVYMHTAAPHSFDIEALYKANISEKSQSWLFWAFFIAFAIKMPVFPFHTWQPNTYTNAPTQGTMLLSGIMLKMGVYGVIRWLLPIAPQGVEMWQHVAVILSVIGIVYSSIIALQQNDLKRLIAYSSIAHVGLISAGVFSANMQGLQGSVAQMVAHGINVVALFFIIDIIENRTGTRQIEQLGGIALSARKLAITAFIVMLGAVALPLTNGFAGEFLLLYGVFEYNNILAAVAGLSIIFGAVYMIRFYQKSMFGGSSAQTANFKDISGFEMAVLGVSSAAILFFGILPKNMLDIAAPAISSVLEAMK